MVERKEVEALLAETELGLTPYPDKETVIALCRAWLALDAGDQGEVVDSNWSEFGVIYSVVPELIGCRVRIVKEKD